MEIVGKLWNIAKAWSPMAVTVLGIVVLLHPKMSLLVAVSIMALQLFLLSYVVLLASTVMDVNPLQYKKIFPSILVTEEGMVMDVRLWQLRKALCPMLVTELGIIKD